MNVGSRELRVVAVFAALAAVVFVATAGAAGPATFAPTISIETSTSRAAAHPDARITIDNQDSTEALKDATIDLPQGFMGSLNAAEQCSVVDAQEVDCPSNTKIGTVTNYATVDDSDVVLTGSIYLTKALPPYDSTDPAGLQIVVPTQIGGVNLGTVHINARVQMNYGEIDPSWTEAPSGATGAIHGVRTIVTDIPRSVTDTHSRTVTFLLKKLVVDLKSDQSSSYSKLLTNPSKCGTTSISLDATSYDSSSSSDTGDYTTDGCDSVSVPDATMSFTSSDHAAGNSFAFETSIAFPDDTPAMNDIELQLPPSVAVDTTAVGGVSDQCPVSNYDPNVTENVFTSIGCPSQAKVGTADIVTPLLPEAVRGDLYLVESSPIPHVAIYVDPTTGPNNPAGVQFGIIGFSSATNKLNSTCSSSPAPPPGGCKTGTSIRFPALPDVPLASITVSVDGTPRPRSGDTDLDGKILRNASNTDPNCQPANDLTAGFTSWVDESYARSSAAVAPYSITGCDPRTVSMTDPPYGGPTTTNPPTFAYTTSPSNTTGKCGVDKQMVVGALAMSACNPTSGAGSFTPSGAIAPGRHYFYTYVASQYNVRGFVVPADVSTDTTAPTVTLDSTPGATTSDTTPSVAFSSDDDAYFQCSLDGGSYLPCDASVSTAGQSGDYTVPNDEALIPSDDDHTIAVRAQDDAGNVSSAQTATFKVVVPLDPTFDVALSTSQARQHPTMDLTVTSGSHEDIKDLALSLPDGFLGGLNGVQTLCPIATANAGNCTSASQAGTVDTEAVVDRSTVRLSGKVYMTEPLQVGDPAGLYIDVPAVIQSIDMGHVLVPIRLTVRDQVKGIDSLATNVPSGITPSDWGNTFDQPSEFDLRSITLHLKDNAAASQPLLTNPSSCNPSAFSATFTGANATQVKKSQGYQATNCGALSFSPSFNMSIVDAESGKAPAESSAQHVVSGNLTADLAMDPNGAAIKDVSLLLPKPVTVNVALLPAPCTVAQYSSGGAEACPASTIVGRVTAYSPLLRAPLEGNVYLVKSTDPSISLPRLLLALRGSINTDIFGNMRFENVSQIRTTFPAIPDAPLSYMHMTVNKVVSTRNEACSYADDERFAQTSFGGQNGAAAASTSVIPITCTGDGDAHLKKNGSKSRLWITARSPDGTKIKSIYVKFPKGAKLVEKKLRKGITFKAGNKTLNHKCWKVRSKGTRLISNSLCKKYNQYVSIKINNGALRLMRKLSKRPKFTITIRDTEKRKYTYTVR